MRGVMISSQRELAQKTGLARRGNRRVREAIIGFMLFVFASISILTTFAVIVVLARETIGLFLEPAVTLSLIHI